ncbi:hypothetical protein EMQ25_07435 [Arsenicitalea aurantiaca]|uniref:Uncharacterized protein n=1 Tax=Arsenicitalea aurantiaca TaxID=1783274 RepID=A0A433XFU0_9HYPH|nr:hypothetical protein [Arsenicitalea aurantiaca]RUT32953.1 hypothetical protein EMQ25_07435 [Arsenicitalea aurantiaca]
MSEMSALSDLARFVGQSALSAEDPAIRRRAVAAITTRLQPRARTRGVSELLGAVLALSARTRRMVMPHVEIELDVFAPGGGRAVRIALPRQS